MNIVHPHSHHKHFAAVAAWFNALRDLPLSPDYSRLDPEQEREAEENAARMSIVANAPPEDA